MTPKDAALRCKALNDDLPDEPSSRKIALQLIQDTVAVCREAMNQHEDPKDSKTKAVTQAVDKSEAMLISKLDPVLLNKITAYAVEFPMIDKDEIRIVLQRDDSTESFKRGLLKALNDERMLEWQTTHRLSAPLI